MVEASDDGSVQEFLLETSDGFRGIASNVHLLLERLLAQPGGRGLVLPNEIISWWETMRERYKTLAPDDRIQFRA